MSDHFPVDVEIREQSDSRTTTGVSVRFFILDSPPEHIFIRTHDTTLIHSRAPWTTRKIRIFCMHALKTISTDIDARTTHTYFSFSSHIPMPPPFPFNIPANDSDHMCNEVEVVRAWHHLATPLIAKTCRQDAYGPTRAATDHNSPSSGMFRASSDAGSVLSWYRCEIVGNNDIFFCDYEPAL